METFNRMITSYPKWLVLALSAAVGCFTLALFLGEPFLAITHKDIPPQPPVLPQAICLTIDVSSSMEGSKLDEVKQAAVNFINRRDLQVDKLALVSFSCAESGFFGIGAKYGATINIGFTQNGQEIASGVHSLSANGNTDFEAAMSKSSEVISSVSEQKVVLLFTDGENTAGDPENAKRIASSLRSEGVRIFAIGTNDADKNFLSELTGNRRQVIGTSDGQFEKAFNEAESLIYSGGLMDSGGAYSFRETLFCACIWTGFLCFGIALFVRMIQNRLLRKEKIIRIPNLIAILVTTAIVGCIAGGCGQMLFGIFSYLGLPYADRIIAWALLGGISAYGLSFFIPNLDKTWAKKSGAVGGILGALAFAFLTSVLGDIGGRLTGAFILGFCIGLAIGVIEAVCREAFIKITFPGNESTTINLGEKAVSLGSGRYDAVFISSVPENAMTFQLNNGQLMCYKNGQSQSVSIGDKMTVGNVMIEVCGSGR